MNTPISDIKPEMPTPLELRMHRSLKAAWPLVNTVFSSNSAKNEIGALVKADAIAGKRVPLLFGLQTAWTFVHGSGNALLLNEFKALLHEPDELDEILTNQKPHWSWRMPDRVHHGQFDCLSKFVIVNLETNIAVEGSQNPGRALRSVEVLNEHALQNGQSVRYQSRPLPVKLHGADPSSWQGLLDECKTDRVTDVRKSRVKTLLEYSREAKFPPLIALLAKKHLDVAENNPDMVDWHVIHEDVIQVSVGDDFDVRNPPEALKSILRLSPACVSRQEQDDMCLRVDLHVQNRMSQHESHRTKVQERFRG